jgi:ribosome-associated toxin RatA of RatAB toxin-antitoxin module
MLMRVGVAGGRVFYQPHSRRAPSRAPAARRGAQSVADIVKSVIVPYTPEQMFGLVDAVEYYPEFLPWCSGVAVARHDGEVTVATLSIQYRGVRQSFTTEVSKHPPRAMRIGLVRGPFRTLDGDWTFTPLSQAGCRVEFRMHYEFSSRLLERLVGPVFNHIASSLVDAFVKRARAIHGTR